MQVKLNIDRTICAIFMFIGIFSSVQGLSQIQKFTNFNCNKRIPTNYKTIGDSLDFHLKTYPACFELDSFRWNYLINLTNLARTNTSIGTDSIFSRFQSHRKLEGRDSFYLEIGKLYDAMNSNDADLMHKIKRRLLANSGTDFKNLTSVYSIFATHYSKTLRSDSILWVNDIITKIQREGGREEKYINSSNAFNYRKMAIASSLIQSKSEVNLFIDSAIYFASISDSEYTKQSMIRAQCACLSNLHDYKKAKECYKAYLSKNSVPDSHKAYSNKLLIDNALADKDSASAKVAFDTLLKTLKNKNISSTIKTTATIGKLNYLLSTNPSQINQNDVEYLDIMNRNKEEWHLSEILLRAQLAKYNPTLLYEFNRNKHRKDSTNRYRLRSIVAKTNAQYNLSKANDLRIKTELINSNLNAKNKSLIVGTIGALLLLIITGLSLHSNIKRRKNLRRMTSAIEESNITITEQSKNLIHLNRELNHRAANQISLAYELILDQRRQIGDEQAKASLERSESQLMALREVNRALAHRSDDLVRADEVLAKVAEGLQAASPHPFNLDLQLKAITVHGNAASRSALILSELLSNSIKYAFPNTNAPQATIRISQNEQGTEISYLDNGPGSDGTVQGTGVGSGLIEAMLEDLDAEFEEIQDEDGTGYGMRWWWG